MRLSQHIFLLAGPMVCLGRDLKADLSIWDIDESCTNYGAKLTATGKATGGTDETPYLQENIDIVLAVAVAAQDSLNFVLEKRPPRQKDGKIRDDYKRWVRIADSMGAVLGFYPDPDRRNSPDEEYWSTVFGVFNKMVATLPSTKNNPEHGYNPRLVKLNPDIKPMIVCGDNWAWLTLDEDVPFRPGVSVSEYWKSRYDMSAMAGAWYKKYRFKVVAHEMEMPIFCGTTQGGKVQVGGAHAALDMILICDGKFTSEAKSKKNPAQLKSTIEEGKPLGDYANNLATTFTHEAIHWFSGITKREGSKYTTLAVTRNGQLLYRTDTGKKVGRKAPFSDASLETMKWKREVAYGPKYIWNLAKKSDLGFSGPEFACKNADSLATFAFMMYYDEWNWAEGGIARAPGPLFDDSMDVDE